MLLQKLLNSYLVYIFLRILNKFSIIFKFDFETPVSQKYFENNFFCLPNNQFVYDNTLSTLIG